MIDACPKCQSTELSLLKRQRAQGYLCFRCKRFRCRFNDHSDAIFNTLEYPTDIVLMVVR